MLKSKKIMIFLIMGMLMGCSASETKNSYSNKATSTKNQQIKVVNKNNNLVMMNWESLQVAKKMVAEKDPYIMPAYNRVMRMADEALAFERMTVVDKVILPASGDKHDYMSFGPYWWPDPSKTDGLPYINRDGKVNPASKDSKSDSPKLLKFTGAIETLGLAYHFTGDKKYADKAVELMKVWFLNSETRMNPNLKHSQAIPGKVDGRAIGMIDSRVLLRVVDGIALIKSSGALSSKDETGIKEWFREFNNWIVDGEYSYEERHWPNNHGTFYDMQVAGFAIFIGDEELAHDTVKNSQYLRLASHIGSKGQNFHELERANPYHYSRFDLEALLALANYGERYEDIKYWEFTANKSKLENAVNYLLPYSENHGTWIFKEKIDHGKDALYLLQAAKVWGVKKYETAIKNAWKINPENRDFLKWPQRIDIGNIQAENMVKK